jgi:hypothetical protein
VTKHSKDEFRRLARDHVWTPPKGLDAKRLRRAMARARLKASLRRIVDAVLGRPSPVERIKEEEREQRE